MKKYILIFIGVLASQIAFAQQTNSIRGKVKAELTETPLEKATVRIIGSDLNTKTDEDGTFIFQKVPTGRLELEISMVGYSKQVVKELVLTANKELVLTILLEESTRDLEGVTVTAASPNLSGAKTSLQSITVEQVMRFPATFFDPARLALSFPGVANANDQANGMSIRGNNPTGLQWRLEGMEIVNPNHTANAGTFSDQATSNAGGVIMVSAQMMGNTNFLTGAFPAEYGNALSGIMDMRLRKGNSQEYEHTAQVGLIGIDLASEGPINKKNGSSYLVNYRYSFTGLLALGGLTFGGETIKFQDLAINLSFPNEKLGDFTVFGMGGVNSNDFAFDDEEGLGPELEKDQYVINYKGKMAAVGATHTKHFKGTYLWKNALVYSGLRNERVQDAGEVATINVTPLEDILQSSKLSFSSILSHRVNGASNLKGGVYVTYSQDSLLSRQNGLAGLYTSWVLEPFVQWNTNIGKAGNLVLGLHNLNYTATKTSTLEPRAAFGYQIDAKNDINLAYGFHSQLNSPWLNDQVADIKPILAHHVVLSEETKLNRSSSIKTEVYYQALSNALSPRFDSKNKFFSGLNMSDFIFPFDVSQNGKGRNYGLEVGYQKYLDKGLFALINATLYKSEFQAADGEFYETRFSGNHIVNLTLGKEWALKKERVFGANLRMVWMGGFRNYAIDEAASEAEGKTVFDYTNELTERLPDYFRPDIRVYLKKSKKKYNTMLSIDIQNVANYQNVAFDYYDVFQKKVVRKNQLGMIPMLNYRWEF
ncbi:TonB-dependent receptor [uncultured Arcticibacterium sp.]|uniref:TonB-dependent receptor n=1 Tax=uncultured Arcticibacterium sp. TaxID=2173042 RepID=UPI0030F5D16D